MAPQPSASQPNPIPQTLALNKAIISKFKPAKVFKGAIDPGAPSQSPNRNAYSGPRHITGISFDDRGDQLITAAEDETFRLYSCKSGKHIKTLYSKKYGVDLPRFTHKNTTIVHASTKEDDTIRYHSLHDNKYLQYFKGHRDRVVSLEVSPVDDTFMSGSMDNTVRLWDLRTPTCRGLLSLPAPPVVAYDQTGMVFAIGINRYSRILLYDNANYDKEPFLTITLEDPTLKQISFPPRPIYMTSLSFSINGDYILVGCSGSAHYILDGFQGHLLVKLIGHESLERRVPHAPTGIEPVKGISGEEVSWTPDNKFVIGGSLDGKILAWDVQNLLRYDGEPDLNRRPPEIKPIVVLDGHPGVSRCVRFNPRLAMLCTAGAELAFWLPDMSGDPEEVAKELLRRRQV